LCVVTAVAGGVILGTAIYNNFIHQPIAPADVNISTLGDAMAAGYEHAAHGTIIGEGLQSLQDDPSVQAAQDRIVDEINNNPKYGKEAYSAPDIWDTFTANGPSGDWQQAGLENNQAFFMVHTGNLSATNTSVTEDGTILTTWVVSDSFDYIPDFRKKGFAYNFYAVPTYFVCNLVLGAEDRLSTSASWQETIPPSQEELLPR
jgi:hypothetical protein